MTTRMLIDARHPEETRVAVANGTRIEEFDFESAQRAQIKGNIYLAKVTRVEPSLQAAFIEYGGNRHGFLAFSEIHPDYYQIPKSDRDALLAEEQAAAREHADDLDEEPPHEGDDGDHDEAGSDDDHHQTGSNDALRKKRQNMRKRYKIQEVIKRRQVLLVQVVKEERGNKGAAMTTYLSLAGRYSVLMPNTSHGGGISRKIASAADRKRLKSIVNELDLPDNMGVIVRTAGASRTKTEVKRDFDYLSRLWDGIRKTTLASAAPALIHEDSDLIKRAIRDLYTREIDEVLVDGEAGFKDAKGFMKLLMPSHAKKVQHYSDAVPIYQRYRIEEQLADMYQPVVQLKSGGYVVINPTEALVSIDINSGKSTREHSIEETAYKTNVEAAREIARQLKLRDMSGLVVIDFIDMDVNGNVRKVEKALKDALKDDRARIQVGRISQFGLMEMSRQRLRTGVLEASTHTCPTCEGAGMVRTTESAGLGALRMVEATALKGKNNDFTVHRPTETAIYLLNERRGQLRNLEVRYGIKVTICPESEMYLGDIDLEARGGAPVPTVDITKPELDEPEEPEEDEIEEDN
ncbi:MAG: ribonuclease E/G, partial [Pacificimonas sp.]